MNKKFEEFFTGHGMEINGNYAYGMISGYETKVIVRIFDNVAPVTIYFSCNTTPSESA